jgi:hypothetical protein
MERLISHFSDWNKLKKITCINALRRFIARRGKPETIRTDNGTNFVGRSAGFCFVSM